MNLPSHDEKPILMLEREAELGEVFEKAVVRLYAKHRSYQRVAEEMQVSYVTLCKWLRMLGIRNRDIRLAVIELSCADRAGNR